MEISITWNICRVCLLDEEQKPQTSGVVAEPMRHIFNDDEILAKQIYDCSGINMKPNDNLPEKICKKCYTLVKYAANFRETCRASDAYLQNIVQRTKSASALLKKHQSATLEETISSDCLNGDKNEDDDAKDTAGKTCPKLRQSENSSDRHKDLEYSDVIECKTEDSADENFLKNSAIHNMLDCIEKEANANVGHDEENEESEIILEFNTSLGQDSKVNEKNVESYVEELEEFVTRKERHQRDMISDIDSESRDSQAKVSSTVAVREDLFKIMELDAEDTKSSGTLDMQTEYLTEEFLTDDKSSDSKCLKNPKKVRLADREYQTRTNRAKMENDTQVWICDICGNQFDSRHMLRLHIKVHRQEKNHECEICLKRFITACNLQAHMRIHTGEKPFECKICGRRFNDRSSNLRHERSHTNEKPFQCQQCGKAFSLSSTLKMHLKVHTGERSYSCSICAKSFKLMHQLKAHRNTSLHKAAAQLIQTDQE